MLYSKSMRRYAQLVAGLIVFMAIAAPGKADMPGAGTTTTAVDPSGAPGGADVTVWGPVAVVALAVLIGVVLFMRQPKKS
jgi:hypothetical protein